MEDELDGQNKQIERLDKKAQVHDILLKQAILSDGSFEIVLIENVKCNESVLVACFLIHHF